MKPTSPLLTEMAERGAHPRMIEMIELITDGFVAEIGESPEAWRGASLIIELIRQVASVDADAEVSYMAVIAIIAIIDTHPLNPLHKVVSDGT